MAEQQSNGNKASESGGHGSTAMKAAVAAAATGVAAIAVTKALSGSQSGSKGESSSGKSSSNGSSGSGSFMSAIASGSWGAAQDALVPLAEEAAGAAGTYLGKNGPELVKERIVPKFIESFNAASGE